MICYEGKKKTKDSNPDLYRKFDALFGILSQTDMAPTSQIEIAVMAAQKELQGK
jgi:hypothetical protein